MPIQEMINAQQAMVGSQINSMYNNSVATGYDLVYTDNVTPERNIMKSIFKGLNVNFKESASWHTQIPGRKAH